MKLSEKMRTERIAAFQPAILDWADEVAQLEAENEAWKKLMREMLSANEQPVVGNFYIRAINLLAQEQDEGSG